MSTSTITHYTGSSGVPEPIANMNPTRARNAARLKRQAGDTATAEALEAHAERSEATFKAANPDYVEKAKRDAPARKLERVITSKDNNPPEDPFLEEIRIAAQPLLDEIADHELRAALLPERVESDEDVAANTAWVVRARALYRTSETRRVEVKEPYLVKGRTVDSFFKDLQTNLTDRAKAIEAKSGPYLQAKAIAEKAARDAAAAAAREEQRLKDAAAAEARRREDEAKAAQLAAEQAIRDAETKAARDAAQAAAQAAAEAAALAAKETKAADKELTQANRHADKAERQADTTKNLERTVAGGGAAALKMVKKYRVDDGVELTLSLGALGGFIASAAVHDALARAAKAERPPRVPGVTFYEEPEVATHALRA